MAENPYESPFEFTTTSLAPPRRPTHHRPTGVTILAVLHVLGGVLLLVMQFMVLSKLQLASEAIRSAGASPAILIISMMFLAILAIVSGIGMWLGTKWGWWVVAFYYVYSVFRNTSALLAFVVVAAQLKDHGMVGTVAFFIKYGGRIVISFLLLLYLFKSNVLAYFRVESISKINALGILLGICIVLFAVTTAFNAITE